jgi:hypothetical protein
VHTGWNKEELDVDITKMLAQMDLTQGQTQEWKGAHFVMS